MELYWFSADGTGLQEIGFRRILPREKLKKRTSCRGERTRTGQKNDFVHILNKNIARGNLIVYICRAYFSLHVQIFHKCIYINLADMEFFKKAEKAGGSQKWGENWTSVGDIGHS